MKVFRRIISVLGLGLFATFLLVACSQNNSSNQSSSSNNSSSSKVSKSNGSMTLQLDAMWDLPQFNHNNLKYYTQPGGNHDAPTMSRIINHYGKYLFK